MRYLPALIALLAVAALSVTLVPAAAQQAPAQLPADASKLRTQLEVMQRVLERSASSTLSRTAGAYYIAYGLGTTHGRVGPGPAVYVAGDGAHFFLTAPFPLVPSESDAESGSDVEPTLWDEVQAEVEGRPLKDKTKSKAPDYNASQVTGLENQILETLAKYGGRLEQLGNSDHITVVVRGSSPGGTLIKRTTGSTDARTAATRALWLTLANSATQPSVLTIRVSRGDAAAAADGRMSASELRSRAVIHRY